MKTHDSVTAELKREFVLNRLLDKGITRSQQGLNIYDCDYSELLYELTLSAFRDIDITNDNERWF